MGYSFLVVLTLCATLVSTQNSAPPERKLRFGSDSDYQIFYRPIHCVLDDRTHFYTIREASVVKLEKKTMKVVARGNLMDSAHAKYVRDLERSILKTKFVTASFEKVEVREALKQVMKQLNFSYSISPEVIGTISLQAKNQPAIEVLDAILDQVESTFREDSNVLQFLKRTSMPFQYAASGAAFRQDRDWIYVFSGENVLKFSKIRMRTEAIVPNN